jgi:hypothetical protein
MSELTNTSTTPLGMLDGIPIKPCMKSGFCCTMALCGYGEWNETGTQCKYLQPPNEIGQRNCGRYDWIMKNAPAPEFYPAFGAGCCAPMFNTMRDNIIKAITNLPAR